MNKSKEKKKEEKKNPEEKNTTSSITTNVYETINIKMPTKLIILAGGIAIFILFIGSLVSSLSDSSGAYKSGVAIFNLGIMALGGTLFMGALTNEQLDSNIKMGMIIAAGIILAVGFINSRTSIF